MGGVERIPDDELLGLPELDCVDSWPKPMPLVDNVDETAAAYPIGALPSLMRDAIEEVVEFVQCPTALASASALSCLSVAVQGRFNVERASGLCGPVSLFLLTLAESGERKTSCDEFFSQGLRQWQQERSESLAEEVARSRASCEAWAAKVEGIKAVIKREATKDTVQLEARLADLVRDKPTAVVAPRLLFSDATPEALAWALSQGWPSAAILSSEAGQVLGGHAMGRESLVRNLALLDTLWDGGSTFVDRRTSPSFAVENVRLTLSLAVQPSVFRTFVADSHGLARGIGFLARLLLSHPVSTQGTRPFREAPAGWPRLGAFNARIRQLLDADVKLDKRGGVDVEVLQLSGAAKHKWIAFHDCVEGTLGMRGEMSSIRDVASKSADNAARLAALFAVLAGEREVSGDAMKAAAVVATWHLYEARRVLGDFSSSIEVEDAARLEAWIVAGRAGHTTRRDIMRCGPSATRDPARLDAAVAMLSDKSRLRSGDGVITVNPLVGGGAHGTT